MNNKNSTQLFEHAKQSLVGGVNSPVRAYSAVQSTPLFIKYGEKSHVVSEDNQHLVDYVLSYGPLILGHAHPAIIDVINKTAQKGTTFGAPTQLETACAEKIKKSYPYVDKVRFVSSGTEATMSAIRLSRAVTNKDLIVKFRGCYHGHADPLLVAAGSGGLSLGTPDSEGVLKSVAEHTIVLEFNDSEGVKQCFRQYGEKIAAVIIEPVCGNMGVVLPNKEFFATLREHCTTSNALLIFDEVMCGFRSQRTGTHEWIGVEPDIVILGKVIGGGLPCGAYAASKKIMSYVSPEGPMYQAGTLSGNPLAMAAGLKTLELLEDGSVFETVNNYTTQLVETLEDISKTCQVPITINHIGSMFSVFFTSKPVQTFNDVSECDLNQFTRYFNEMIRQDIILPPSQFEACFTSCMHNDDDLAKTAKAFEKALLKANV